MIRIEAAVAMLCFGALGGFVAGATIGRPVSEPRLMLRVPPDHWPVEIVARGTDGRDVRMRFACTGEVIR
jgi:hypothetical protein